MNIDEYIERRNELQLNAERLGEKAAEVMWQRLGMANRHIGRVLSGTLALTPRIEQDIENCFRWAQKDSPRADET